MCLLVHFRSCWNFRSDQLLTLHRTFTTTTMHFWSHFFSDLGESGVRCFLKKTKASQNKIDLFCIDTRFRKKKPVCLASWINDVLEKFCPVVYPLDVRPGSLSMRKESCFPLFHLLMDTNDQNRDCGIKSTSFPACECWKQDPRQFRPVLTWKWAYLQEPDGQTWPFL